MQVQSKWLLLYKLIHCKECENKPHNQVVDDKGVDEPEEDESNDDIMDFLEDFKGIDGIDSHENDEDDSSDVETDYNGYEQDYAYAKDDRADDKLLKLFEMINDDETVKVTKKTWKMLYWHGYLFDNDYYLISHSVIFYY